MPNVLRVPGFMVDTINSATPNPGLILGHLLSWYGSSARGFNKVGAIRVSEPAALLTIAAAATTDSVEDLLPANSLILAVLGRVTTVIPTAASFTVGDPTQAARFATGVLVAATTTFVGFLHWNPAVASDNLGPRQTAAAKVRITPNLTPANNSGRLALQVIYLQFTPPTA